MCAASLPVRRFTAVDGKAAGNDLTGMAKPPTPPPKNPAPKAEREARLAAALRVNLRRRKAQLREREAVREAAPAPPEGEERS
jgi:hypothetical protein